MGSSWATQLLGESIGRIQERKKSLDSCRYRRNKKQWDLVVVMLKDALSICREVCSKISFSRAGAWGFSWGTELSLCSCPFRPA